MIHIKTVKIFSNDKQSKWPKIICFVAALLASLVSRAAEFFKSFHLWVMNNWSNKIWTCVAHPVYLLTQYNSVFNGAVWCGKLTFKPHHVFVCLRIPFSISICQREKKSHGCNIPWDRHRNSAGNKMEWTKIIWCIFRLPIHVATWHLGYAKMMTSAVSKPLKLIPYLRFLFVFVCLRQ